MFCLSFTHLCSQRVVVVVIWWIKSLKRIKPNQIIWVNLTSVLWDRDYEIGIPQLLLKLLTPAAERLTNPTQTCPIPPCFLPSPPICSRSNGRSWYVLAAGPPFSAPQQTSAFSSSAIIITEAPYHRGEYFNEPFGPTFIVHCESYFITVRCLTTIWHATASGIALFTAYCNSCACFVNT